MLGLRVLFGFSLALAYVSAWALYDFSAASRWFDKGQQQIPLGQDGSRSEPYFPGKPSHKGAGFVALGDSYSAGIGTGVGNSSEDACRTGHHAYPKLISDDWAEAFGVSPAFQFLSCTGSTIEDVLTGSSPGQIDGLNTTLEADFALLSVGGNDLGFFDIMNSCIFRFYSLYSGTCEAALKQSENALRSPEFDHMLGLVIMEILDKVKWEKRPWFTVTVTGYAQFFNAETQDCDERSFGVWWRGPKLERKLRRRMNQMVKDVNNKIRRSVDLINAKFAQPKVFFLDYDAAFEGHRFCEANVTEPDYGRNETWFFLVGGLDNDDAATNVSSRLQPAPLPGIGISDPEECLNKAEVSGDWGEKAVCLMARAARDDPSLRFADGRLAAENSMWYVPTYYGKTFHPRTKGHMAIRDGLYQLWETRKLTRLKPGLWPWGF